MMVDYARAAAAHGRRRFADPMALVIWAAHTVGWSFLNATTIWTDRKTIQLTRTFPAALRQHSPDDVVTAHAR